MMARKPPAPDPNPMEDLGGFFIAACIFAIFIWILCQAAIASPTRRGKASTHPYPHSGYVTAARGVRRGATLLVWNPAKPNIKLRVKVVDACGLPMKRIGRILDLGPRTFRRLYGTSTGVFPVRYKLITDGKGAYCGKPWF